MDLVILDMPCSGSGTLRRNPDMKWKFDPSAFEELVKINPEYYSDKDSCYRRFGFHTLDLSGDFKSFKTKLDNFVEQISELASLSTSES